MKPLSTDNQLGYSFLNFDTRTRALAAMSCSRSSGVGSLWPPKKPHHAARGGQLFHRVQLQGAGSRFYIGVCLWHP
jgi:hypothetical protein